MSDRRALYVRLPAAKAAKLDRAAFELNVSKQDLIAGLIDEHLDVTATPRRVAVELGDDGLTVGRHEFRPAPAPDVLNAAEAAELLRTAEQAVLELAENGELPGRRIAGEWRFARAAVLDWLAGAAPA